MGVILKGESDMKVKLTNEKTAKFVANVATKTLKTDANSASCMLVYQPKAPKALNQFKKK